MRPRIDVAFLHCLPAHRGEEVTHDVLEGDRSHVWLQAENRMHAARGLLAWLMTEAAIMNRRNGPTKLGKAQRQHLVAKLIEQHTVQNQTQLVDLLAADDVVATQATVSRDLEDLGAIKVRVPGGESAYAIPALPKEQRAPEDHLRRVFGDWVVEVAHSGNLVVLRTPPGSAHVVGSGARPGRATGDHRHGGGRRHAGRDRGRRAGRIRGRRPAARPRRPVIRSTLPELSNRPRT